MTTQKKNKVMLTNDEIFRINLAILERQQQFRDMIKRNKRKEKKADEEMKRELKGINIYSEKMISEYQRLQCILENSMSKP